MLIFYGQDSAIEEVLKELSIEDIYITDDSEQVLAWLEENREQDSFLFLDFDLGEKKVKKFNASLVDRPHLTRIIFAGKESFKALRKHQKSKAAAHGYFQKPLTSEVLLKVLNNFQLADFVSQNNLFCENTKLPTLPDDSIASILTRSNVSLKGVVSAKEVLTGIFSTLKEIQSGSEERHYHSSANDKIQKLFDAVFGEDGGTAVRRLNSQFKLEKEAKSEKETPFTQTAIRLPTEEELQFPQVETLQTETQGPPPVPHHEDQQGGKSEDQDISKNNLSVQFSLDDVKEGSSPDLESKVEENGPLETPDGDDIKLDMESDEELGSEMKLDLDVDLDSDLEPDADDDPGTILDVGTDAGTSLDLDVGTDAGTSLDLDVGTDAGTSLDLDVGTDAGTDSGLSLEESADETEDAELDLSTGEEVDSELDLSKDEEVASELDLSADEKAGPELDLSEDEEVASALDLSADEKASSELGLSEDEEVASALDLSADEKASSELDLSTEKEAASELDLSEDEEVASALDLSAEEEVASELDLSEDQEVDFEKKPGPEEEAPVSELEFGSSEESTPEPQATPSEHDSFAEKAPPSFYEGEALRFQATIGQLRKERDKLLAEIREAQTSIRLTEQDNLGLRSELDESKIEISILKKRHEEEVSELKYKLRFSDDKRMLSEEKSSKLQKEFDRLQQKVRIDFEQVTKREKTLESQLELVQMDSDAQLKTRNQKILELKRKIDQLEFSMENAWIKEQKSKDDKLRLQEGLERLAKTLKTSVESLEEDFGPEIKEHLRQVK